MGRNQRNRKESKVEQKKETKQMIEKRAKEQFRKKIDPIMKVTAIALFSIVLLWGGKIALDKLPKKSINQVEPKKIATIETEKGNIEIEIFEKDAPKTAENFMLLAKKGYYDGTKFHRVVDDFVIQGGDPLSKDNDSSNDGTGGESAFGGKFEDEINAKSLGLSAEIIKQYESEGYKYNDKLNSHKMEAGSVAMANSGANTNASQFFIVTTKAQPHLDGKHTVFGKVVKGMDVIKNIKQNDIMKKVTVREVSYNEAN